MADQEIILEQDTIYIPAPPDFLCDLPAIPKIPCITLPGGIDICANIDIEKPPSDCAVTTDVLGLLNTALAPLNPLMLTIQLVQAIIDAVIAIPESIITLDPTLPFERVADLLEAFVNFLGLLPAFSLPALLMDLVGFFLALFQCVLSFLVSIRDQFELIARTLLSASPTDAEFGFGLDALANAKLEKILSCAEAELNFQMSLFSDSFQTGVMGMLTIFLNFLDMFLKVASIIPGLQDQATELSDTIDFLTDPGNAPTLEVLDPLIESLEVVVDILTVINNLLNANLGDIEQELTDMEQAYGES
jgi:hypothetical protein